MKVQSANIENSPIRVGNRAPDFSLPTQTGKIFRLSNYLGKKAVVLYFYPKDDSPGCTAESCAFRDSHAIFEELDAEIVGISADSAESHLQFAKKYDLPFILLSDTNDRVRKLYGVPSSFFILPGRVTYVIDKGGIIRRIFDSQVDFKSHVKEALKTLQAVYV